MRWDPVGLLIFAGMLVPVLVASRWAVVLERRTRAEQRRQPDDLYYEDRTVSAIEARIRHEREEQRITSIGTDDLPTQPILITEDLVAIALPRRTPGAAPGPRTVPAPRRAGSILSRPGPSPFRIGFAQPDVDLMQRVVDGLRTLPDRRRA